MSGNLGSAQTGSAGVTASQTADPQVVCLELGATKISVLWGKGNPLRVLGLRTVARDGVGGGASPCSTLLGDGAGPPSSISGPNSSSVLGLGLGSPEAELLVTTVRRALTELGGTIGSQDQSILVTSSCLDVRMHDHEVILELGGRAITSDDVANLNRMAGEWGPARGERVLWSKLCDFRFDEEENLPTVTDPVGRSAERLTARVVVVSAPEQQIRLLADLLHQAGCGRVDFIACPIAGAYAVTQESERLQGVVVIDLGAAYTQVSAFEAGHLLQVGSFPGGAQRIVEGLARRLAIPSAEAAALTRKQACPLRWMVDAGSQLVLSDGRRIPARQVSDIVADALAETFDWVAERLRLWDPLWKGSPSCVLTGGGSRLPAIVEYVEEMLRLPTRIGQPWLESAPNGIELGPEQAALVGVLRVGPAFIATRAARHSWVKGLKPNEK